MGGFEPKAILDFSSTNLFQMESQSDPNIVVICLQEIISLNPKNIVGFSNEKQIGMCEKIFLENLKKLNDYVFVEKKEMVGLLILIFSLKNFEKNITNIETCSVKCGINPLKLGNKGAVIIKMEIKNSSVCFINCHLNSGNKSTKERISNINNIHENAFKKNKKVFLSLIFIEFFLIFIHFRKI